MENTTNDSSASHFLIAAAFGVSVSALLGFVLTGWFEEEHAILPLAILLPVEKLPSSKASAASFRSSSSGLPNTRTFKR
jgi:hypothetical protein